MKEEKVIFSDYPIPPSAKYVFGVTNQMKKQADKAYCMDCMLWDKENELHLRRAHSFLDKHPQFRIKIYLSLHRPSIFDDDSGNLIDDDPSKRCAILMENLTESIRIEKNRFTSTLIEKLQITYKVPEHVNIVITSHKMRVFQ